MGVRETKRKSITGINVDIQNKCSKQSIVYLGNLEVIEAEQVEVLFCVSCTYQQLGG